MAKKPSFPFPPKKAGAVMTPTFPPKAKKKK